MGGDLSKAVEELRTVLSHKNQRNHLIMIRRGSVEVFVRAFFILKTLHLMVDVKRSTFEHWVATPAQGLEKLFPEVVK